LSNNPCAATVYKDVVNSDQIKITKAVAMKYGLPKGAINKTPAEYSDMIEKTYKGREVDPFAQTSKEMELNNLAKMSSELAEQFNQNTEFAIGGGLNGNPGFPPILNPQRLAQWKKEIAKQKRLGWGTPNGNEIWDPFQNDNMKVPGFYSGVGLMNKQGKGKTLTDILDQ